MVVESADSVSEWTAVDRPDRMVVSGEHIRRSGPLAVAAGHGRLVRAVGVDVHEVRPVGG